MVAFLNDQRLNAVVPAAAFGTGALVALVIAVLPDWRLAGLGLDALSSSLAPPFGVTARSLLALAGGAVTAGAGYGLGVAALRLRPMTAPARDVPVLRRADAHPDAPARRPLHASEDLGQPLPMGSAPASVAPTPIVLEKPLPADLETPLAMLDPGAIPDVPREPVRPVTPLAVPTPPASTAIDAGERFETFELTPIRRRAATQATPVAAPATRRGDPAGTSISALLDRLERGAASRDVRPRTSLEETIGMLRGLATH